MDSVKGEIKLEPKKIKNRPSFFFLGPVAHLRRDPLRLAARRISGEIPRGSQYRAAPAKAPTAHLRRGPAPARPPRRISARGPAPATPPRRISGEAPRGSRSLTSSAATPACRRRSKHDPPSPPPVKQKKCRFQQNQKTVVAIFRLVQQKSKKTWGGSENF